MDLIKHLLVDGADVNAIAPTGLSPIGWAAMKGEEHLVKILVDFHADVEAGFLTPLFLAAKHGKLKIVKFLLDHGANIDSCDDRGRTPLSIAASAGNEAILSCGHSKAGMKAIHDLTDQRNQSLLPAELLGEQFMKSLRKAYWPNHRLRHEPTTWRSTVFSKEGADPYRDDEPCSQFDLEFSDNPRVYSEIVDLLLQRGANVDSQDMFCLTPLWWAVNWGHLPVMRRLLQNNAFVENGGAFRMTPLSWAIWNGHQNVVQMLLDNRASVNTLEFGVASPLRRSPLFWAICNGSQSQLLQLLSHGIQVPDDAATELAMSEGHYAIAEFLYNRNTVSATQGAIPSPFQAILANEENVIDTMLGHGVDTEILYENSWTPLTLAAAKGCFAVVQRLLDQEVNPNIMDGEGRTALMVAASLGLSAMVRVLIEKGANVNARSNNGPSILQQATINGHVMAVNLLLRDGADIEADNDIGTPLILASLEGHSAIVKLLLGHNANINARNSNGETALLVAAKYNYGGDVDGKVAVTSLLLQHGADIDARSKSEFTPIILASRAGYTDLVKLLLWNNANVDTRDFEGRSALDWSAVREHWVIEQILREKHGDRVLEVPDNAHDTPN